MPVEGIRAIELSVRFVNNKSVIIEYPPEN